MIFSLLAKSSALSKGILFPSVWVGAGAAKKVTHQTPFRCIGPIFTT